jgi:hypothetical protein
VLCRRRFYDDNLGYLSTLRGCITDFFGWLVYFICSSLPSLTIWFTCGHHGICYWSMCFAICCLPPHDFIQVSVYMWYSSYLLDIHLHIKARVLVVVTPLVCNPLHYLAIIILLGSPCRSQILQTSIGERANRDNRNRRTQTGVN